MIAIVIMTVGLLAVMASFVTAITATASAQEDLIARKALMPWKHLHRRNSQHFLLRRLQHRQWWNFLE